MHTVISFWKSKFLASPNAVLIVNLGEIASLRCSLPDLFRKPCNHQPS